jgi:hypothetical protein
MFNSKTLKRLGMQSSGLLRFPDGGWYALRSGGLEVALLYTKPATAIQNPSRSFRRCNLVRKTA